MNKVLSFVSFPDRVPSSRTFTASSDEVDVEVFGAVYSEENFKLKCTTEAFSGLIDERSKSSQFCLKI